MIRTTLPQSVFYDQTMLDTGNFNPLPKDPPEPEFHDTHAETAHTEVESCLAHGCDHRIAYEVVEPSAEDVEPGCGINGPYSKVPVLVWMTIYHEKDDYDS